MSSVTLENSRQAVSFKNEQLSCTFLKISSGDSFKIKSEIDDLTQKAPKLLHNLPLILDCNFDDLYQGDLANLYKTILSIPLNIVGIVDYPNIKNSNPPWPILSNVKNNKSKAIANLKTKVIDRRVRSGDIIEAPNLHLVILGSVGSGAEIYATGNIYIWGKLQGKAFAGMNGASDAFITCKEFDAELVAISGVYSMQDTEKFCREKSVKIYLDEDTLNYVEIK